MQQILRLVNHSPRLIILSVVSLAYLTVIIALNLTEADNHWNKGDAYHYHFMANSILQDGDLDLSNNHSPLDLYDGDFALSQYGYPTAKQSPLMSIVALPFLALLGPIGGLWFNLICSIGLLLILFEIIKFWVSDFAACLSTLVVGIFSVLLRYAFNFSPDVFSCLLLLGMLLFTFQNRWSLAGLLLGMAVTAKVGNIILVVPMLFYCLWVWSKITSKAKLTAGVLLATCSMITIVPFMYYNHWLFGSFLQTGYQHILTQDVNGTSVLLSHTNDFNNGFFEGIGSLFFNSNNGLFWDNLIVVLLGMLGLVYFKSTHLSKLLLLASIAAIQIIFYSLYDHQLATLWGNRFLLLSIAFLALPIAWLIEAIHKALIRKGLLQSVA